MMSKLLVLSNSRFNLLIKAYNVSLASSFFGQRASHISCFDRRWEPEATNISMSWRCMGVRWVALKLSIVIGGLCLLPLNDKASESNAMTASHADNLWSERLHIITAEHLASVSNVTFHPPLSHLTV